MIFTKVDPDALAPKAKTGRGAWTRKGIDFDYRYAVSKETSQRIGTRAEVSLDHWAVAAGSFAIQKRLIELGFLTSVGDNERGIFGPRTQVAVRDFQSAHVDPQTKARLTVDGIVGRSDTRALFTPVVHAAEDRYSIPDSLLLGQTSHESMLDPGCVGYYIYYGEEQDDYRGVDRGLSQINSRFNPQVTWAQAYDPAFALDWSAKRLRDFYDRYLKAHPRQSKAVLWDAAVCAHNNPAAANNWAKNGRAPHDQAAKYVAAVKAAIY